MESNYLSKRSKKAREHIERFIEGRRELYGDNCFTKEYLTEKIIKIFNALVTERKEGEKEHFGNDLEQRLKQYFPARTVGIGNAIYNYIFYERMVNDNLDAFYNGLYTAQRIFFIGDRYGSRGRWAENIYSYIMIRFRSGLAVYDEQLVNAYVKQIPGPFTSGYPFYVSLATGLYLIFESKLQEASSFLEKRLKLKSTSKYERSILLAVKAIADKDKLSFVSEVNNSLKLYSRQSFYCNLADDLSLEALSLYNLANRVWGETPAEPESEYWDHEFYRYINNTNLKPKILPDFSKLSPLFEKWIKELPSETAITDLDDDIKKHKSP